MTSIALIAEGITDQIAIEHIILEYAARHFEHHIDVQPFRPRRDETDRKQADFGGWGLVFESLPAGIDEALSVNDFVIVHVDTDVCETPGFDVPLTADGTLKPPQKLVADTIFRLISEIGCDTYLEYRDRIIFAIPVRSTECWLIQLLFSSSTVEKTRDCESKLRRLFASKKIKYQKNGPFYQKHCRKIRIKDPEKVKSGDESLSLFLHRLDSALAS